MNDRHFITVILPLALPKNYTYEVSAEQIISLKVGHRVEVELKKKLYTAIVLDIQATPDSSYSPKPIVGIVDEDPIVDIHHIKFWQWIADYYCCTIGEVMDAALPSGLKLQSETKLILIDEDEVYSPELLSDEEYLIVEALTIQKELKFHQVKDILGKKSIYTLIRSLLDKEVIQIKEELIQKYKPKRIKVASLAPEIKKSNRKMEEAIALTERSDKQTRALLSLITLSRTIEFVPLSELVQHSNTDYSITKALAKKGIITISSQEASRIFHYTGEITEELNLSEEQLTADIAIHESFKQRLPVLLHGVTGSGKTRVYTELINETISKGKQVLFLLPEIALTTQIVERLMFIYGNDIVLYHSKLSNEQRVEIWNSVSLGKKIVLGARSAMFLPFKSLSLIIVDEEHDSSYKQSDPSPRYNARDCALVLARQINANIVLGSATPSLESYFNATQKRYSLIELNQRYGDAVLPKIEIVDLKQERKTGRLRSSISHQLKEKMVEILGMKKQVILFQNRRGFAPVVQCEDCGWSAQCVNCDVSLTLHRYTSEMRCHYCNYRIKLQSHCPSCGSDNLKDVGIGTERIVAEVKEQFPGYTIARLDIDSAKTKASMDQIVADFKHRETDILVGTQMVTKGFDFDHIALVGIINADALIRFTDFRAEERAFQLMVQVGGRAGRRAEQGTVIIQAYSANHVVLQNVIDHDYKAFFQRQMDERATSHFPPLCKMIELEIKHQHVEKVDAATSILLTKLKENLGDRVKGPIVPSISRIQNMYIRNILIKLENESKLLTYTKNYLNHLKGVILNTEGIKNTRINIDVDPY